MRKKLVTSTFALLAFAAGVVHAAPRQVVVVIADGLNPQTVDFGATYVKTAYQPGTLISIEELKAEAKAQPGTAVSVAGLQGLLKTAAASGYKTGLVTTADVATDAASLYDVMGAAGLARDANFDFVAGGGRAAFGADAIAALKAAGGSALTTVGALDDETTGKTLVLQSEGTLNYALDRDIKAEPSFAELVTMALEKLGVNNSPFVLVVHDTLIAQALAAKDTPALLEQVRELDNAVAEVRGARENAPAEFAIAFLGAGAATAPRLTTEVSQERSDAFNIVAGLPLSFTAAGKALTGADDAKLTAFADAKTGRYKGWMITPANRAALLAGTMTAESAIRASYEPAIKVAYVPVEAQTVAYGVNLDLQGDAGKTLRAWAATKPAAAK